MEEARGRVKVPNLWRVIPLALIVALAFALAKARDDRDRERLARFNAEAQRDTSRVLLRDSTGALSERLAFQQQRAFALDDALRRQLRLEGQRVELLTRLRVSLDSLTASGAGIVTQGSDSSIRNLVATIDSAGYHVGIRAQVPAPPSVAQVQWTVRRDPIEIVAALARDSAGRAALRVHSGPNTAVRIDSAVTVTRRNLSATQRLASVGLLLLGGFVLGKLL